MCSSVDWHRLHSLLRDPVARSGDSTACPPEKFAILLSDIYASDDPLHSSSRDLLKHLPKFSIGELKRALKAMRNRRCPDKNGVVVEMLQQASSFVHLHLLALYNRIICTGTIEDHWREVYFTMVPKSGDLTEATNWRPIAILSVFYKVFSRMVYNRIVSTLEAQQSADQHGFRSGIRLEDALMVVETVVSRYCEFNKSLYIASLDVRKAFDRIQHGALFAALREQGADECTIALITELYKGQRGKANGSRFFDICRGVKQGDVLSSLLFNSCLEMVFRRWKLRVSSHGLFIMTNCERLTNTRYADDVLLYSTSLSGIREMLSLLHDELAKVGLQMHGEKTKVLTNVSHETPLHITVGDMQVEVLATDACHKYLGRQLCLDSSNRVRVEVDNRCRSAWAKFHQCRRWLTNCHIPLKQRIKYLDTVIRPSAIFGLHVLPLTCKHLQQLAVLQRRMLRSVVGWRRLETDTWEETMRRMKSRVARALELSPSEPWDHVTLRQQWRFMLHVRSSTTLWSYRMAAWTPTGCRNVGRPKLRWDDYLCKFVRAKFFLPHWNEVDVELAKNVIDEFVTSVVH